MVRSKPGGVMVTKTFFERYGRRVEAIMGEHGSDQIVLISDEEEIETDNLEVVENAHIEEDESDSDDNSINDSSVDNEGNDTNQEKDNK